MKKLTAWLVLLSLMAIPLINPRVTSAQPAVQFIQTGSRYIFSNNPEPIKETAVANAAYGQYSIEQPLLGQVPYDCDFTHVNKTNAKLTMGIAVINTTKTPNKVRVISEALRNSVGYLNEFTDIALAYQKGLSDKKDRYINVPADSTVILMANQVPKGYCVYGKTKFVPLANGLKLRIFWIKTDKFTIPKLVNTLPKAIEEQDMKTSPWARTTAAFVYDARYATIDCSVIKSVYLGALHPNPGEYEKGTNVTGNPYLIGNYGITYDLQLKNFKGKQLKINPKNSGYQVEQLVLWDAKQGWYKTSVLRRKTNNEHWLINIQPDGHLKYTLPSMNCGVLLFEFVDAK